MNINRFPLKSILEKLSLPVDLKTINRVTHLLQNRNEINETDQQNGINDDVLDDIQMRMRIQDGSLLNLAKKVKLLATA